MYSEHQKRWIHVEVSGNAWDKPHLYTTEKRKEISYCIAFSVDGATDVTNRYVRELRFSLPRTRCSEEDLRDIIQEIKTKFCMGKSEEERFRLESEDSTEAGELQSYHVAFSRQPALNRFGIGRFPSGESSVMGAKRSRLSDADVKRARS